MIFLFSLLCSVLLLFLFSAFFTGRVLRPIERNRKKQTEFIHAASHELRSPLAVIKTSLSIIPETEEAEKIHFCQMAKDECDRMSGLIEQMLFLASHDSGSYQMQFSDIEAETLILTSFERFEGIASAKEINLFVIPNEEPLRKITADKEKLLQVLAILLDNALQYTPKGGSIWLSAKEKNGKIKIMVSDNGPGIPKEDQSAVFERFFRREESHSDKQHFGLGLSIAKEIITRHKGKITVQERVGGGAFFTITLN